jgi:hypothetical protein
VAPSDISGKSLSVIEAISTSFSDIFRRFAKSSLAFAEALSLLKLKTQLLTLCKNNFALISRNSQRKKRAKSLVNFAKLWQIDRNCLKLKILKFSERDKFNSVG